MKRVLTAAILIPLVLLALFKAPLWLLTLLVFGVAVLAAHEYFEIVKAQGFQPFAMAGYAFFALSFASIYALAYYASLDYVDGAGGLALILMLGLLGGLALITLIAALTLLLAGLSRDPLSHALPDAAVTLMALPYLAFTLGLLPLLRASSRGAIYLLFVMLLVWCGDIAAYYVGSAMGKHRLAPRVSPGKTWEGAAASVVAAMLVSWLLFRFVGPISADLHDIGLLSPFGHTHYSPQRSAPAFVPVPVWLTLLFGAAINIAAQFGDLVESALKRGAGVKDSGTLLPGHGGVLDRIDALLYALPVALIFYLSALIRYFDAA